MSSDCKVSRHAHFDYTEFTGLMNSFSSSFRSTSLLFEIFLFPLFTLDCIQDFCPVTRRVNCRRITEMSQIIQFTLFHSLLFQITKIPFSNSPYFLARQSIKDRLLWTRLNFIRKKTYRCPFFSWTRIKFSSSNLILCA